MTGRGTPKHIQETRHRERVRGEDTVCDHSDLVIDEEEETLECSCGMTKDISGIDVDLETDIVKPSMRRARLREVMRELERKGELR